MFSCTWILDLTLATISQGSTSRTIILPVNVVTKICIGVRPKATSTLTKPEVVGAEVATPRAPTQPRSRKSTETCSDTCTSQACPARFFPATRAGVRVRPLSGLIPTLARHLDLDTSAVLPLASPPRRKVWAARTRTAIESAGSRSPCGRGVLDGRAPDPVKAIKTSCVSSRGSAARACHPRRE